MIDGNSTDNTVDVALTYTDRLYSDEGKGLSYARQLGALQATQEFLAYVDSDVALTQGALEAMLDVLQRSNSAWANARLASDMECAGYWEWARYQHDLLSQEHGVRRDFLSTVAGLTRRETVLSYGFNMRDSRMDDADLEIRLRKDRQAFANSSAAYYKRYPRDVKSLVKQRFLYGLLAPRYLKEYGLRQFRFWLPLTDAYWLSFCLLRGKFKMIPYFAVEAVIQTAGMVKGLLQPRSKPLAHEGK